MNRRLANILGDIYDGLVESVPQNAMRSGALTDAKRDTMAKRSIAEALLSSIQKSAERLGEPASASSQSIGMEMISAEKRNDGFVKAFRGISEDIEDLKARIAAGSAVGATRLQRDDAEKARREYDRVQQSLLDAQDVLPQPGKAEIYQAFIERVVDDVMPQLKQACASIGVDLDKESLETRELVVESLQRDIDRYFHSTSDPVIKNMVRAYSNNNATPLKANIAASSGAGTDPVAMAVGGTNAPNKANIESTDTRIIGYVPLEVIQNGSIPSTQVTATKDQAESKMRAYLTTEGSLSQNVTPDYRKVRGKNPVNNQVDPNARFEVVADYNAQNILGSGDGRLKVVVPLGDLVPELKGTTYGVVVDEFDYSLLTAHEISQRADAIEERINNALRYYGINKTFTKKELHSFLHRETSATETVFKGTKSRTDAWARARKPINIARGATDTAADHQFVQETTYATQDYVRKINDRVEQYNQTFESLKRDIASTAPGSADQAYAVDRMRTFLQKSTTYARPDEISANLGDDATRSVFARPLLRDVVERDMMASRTPPDPDLMRNRNAIWKDPVTGQLYAGPTLADIIHEDVLGIYEGRPDYARMQSQFYSEVNAQVGNHYVNRSQLRSDLDGLRNRAGQNIFNRHPGDDKQIEAVIDDFVNIYDRVVAEHPNDTPENNAQRARDMYKRVLDSGHTVTYEDAPIGGTRTFSQVAPTIVSDVFNSIDTSSLYRNLKIARETVSRSSPGLAQSTIDLRMRGGTLMRASSEIRPTLRSQFLQSIEAVMRVERSIAVERGRVTTSAQAYAFYLHALMQPHAYGSPGSSQSLKAVVNREQARNSLLNQMRQFVSTEAAHKIVKDLEDWIKNNPGATQEDISIYLGAAVNRSGRRDASGALIGSDFADSVEDGMKHSDWYRSKMLAESKMVAKVSMYQRIMQGAKELNPLDFNNLMTAEALSVAVGQGLIAGPTPLIFAAPIVRAFNTLVLRNVVPGMTALDFIPFIGKESLFRKRGKEILSGVPDWGFLFKGFINNPFDTAIKSLKKHSIYYAQLASHFYRLSSAEGQVRILNNWEWHDRQLAEYTIRKFQRRALKIFGIDRNGKRIFDPNLRFNMQGLSWINRFRALFYHRMMRRNGSDRLATLFLGLVLDSAAAAIGATFERVALAILGEGVGDIKLFSRFRNLLDTVKTVQSDLGKSAVVGEGAAIRPVFGPDLTFAQRLINFTGHGLFYGRLVEALTMSAMEGGIRGLIFGGLEYAATGGIPLLGSGGNLPLALAVGGVQGGWHFFKSFPGKVFMKLQEEGGYELTSWARQGRAPDANIFKKLLAKWADAATPYDPHYSLRQALAIVSGTVERGIDVNFREATAAFNKFIDDKTGVFDRGEYYKFLDGKSPLDPTKTRLDVMKDGVHDHISSSTASIDDIRKFIPSGTTIGPEMMRADAVLSTRPVADFRAWLNQDHPSFFDPTTHAPLKNWQALSDEVARDHTLTTRLYTQDERIIEGALNAARTDTFGTWSLELDKVTGVGNLKLLERAAQNTIGSTSLDELRHFEKTDFSLGAKAGVHPNFSVYKPLRESFLKFRTLGDAAINGATIFLICDGFNQPGLGLGLAAAYTAFTIFKDPITGWTKMNIVDPFVNKANLILNEKFADTFKFLAHTTKFIDAAFYIQLSAPAGPVAPIVQGWKDMGAGWNQMGKATQEFLNGNENFAMDFLPGAAQFAGGAFNIAGIGIGLSGIVGAVGGVTDLAVGLIPGVTLPADVLIGGLSLGLSPIGLIVGGVAAATFVIGDLVTGGAFSRWVSDRVGDLASAIWTLVSPTLESIIADHFGLALFVGLGAVVGGAIGFFLTIASGGLIGLAVGSVLGGIAGGILYNVLDINDMFANVLGGISLVAFLISFIFLFRKKDIASAVFSVFLMAFSLAQLGILFYFPIFLSSPSVVATGVGTGVYGSTAGIACFSGSTTTDPTFIPGECTNGNQDSTITTDPNHYYSMAADIVPANLTSTGNGADFPVYSPVDGTIVQTVIQYENAGDAVRIQMKSQPDVSVELYHLKIDQSTIHTGVSVTAGTTQIGTVADGSYVNVSNNWSGPHVHVQLIYCTPNNCTDLTGKADNGTSNGCPVYNAVTVFTEPANGSTQSCATAGSNCSTGHNLGCYSAPVNGPIETLPHVSKSSAAACPIHSTLIDAIKTAATATHVPPALLAAELEYNTYDYYGNKGIEYWDANGTANWNTDILLQSNTTPTQTNAVARIGGEGMFSDTLSNTSLQTVLNANNHPVNPNVNPAKQNAITRSLQNDLYATGVIFNTYFNSLSVITDSKDGVNQSNLTFSITNQDYSNPDISTIQSIAQNYVCRGAQDEYPSCGVNESQSIASLYQYFKSACF